MPNSPARRVLLCDLDNTLVDRDAAFRRWATALTAGHPDESLLEFVVAEDRRGYRDKPDFFEAIRERVGLTDPIDVLRHRFDEEFPPHFTCADEVRAALAAARAAGWAIAIVTNGHAAQLRKIEATALGDAVDAVCVSSAEGVWKPDPGILRLAAERCGATLVGAWMIGDNAHADIGAAHAAGIDSAWITEGRAWDRADYRPTIEVDTFAEAVAHILALA